MKKMLIILIGCILLTGCSATVNLNIIDDTYSENVVLEETDTSIFDKEIVDGFTFRDNMESYSYSDPYSEENYSKEFTEEQNKLSLKFDGEFDINDIEKSSFLNQCYEDFLITIDSDNIVIDTGDNFKCYEYYEYLDDISITLKTNHKVMSTNGKKNSDGTYTWEFTKDSNHQIKLTLSKEVKEIDYKAIILISIVLILLIGYKIYLDKKNK